MSSAPSFSIILQSVLSRKQGRTWWDRDDGGGHLVTVVLLHSGSRIPSKYSRGDGNRYPAVGVTARTMRFRVSENHAIKVGHIVDQESYPR